MNDFALVQVVFRGPVLRNALDEAVQALSVDMDNRHGGGASGASPANQCVCHVGNISWETTDDTLHELFSGYGEVVSAEVQICA